MILPITYENNCFRIEFMNSVINNISLDFKNIIF